jgi:hypothetical protein
MSDEPQPSIGWGNERAGIDEPGAHLGCEHGGGKDMRRKGECIAAVAAIVMELGMGGTFLPNSAASAEPVALSVEATKHMVKECRQQHENVANMIDELLVEMEMAQRSLDAARTRAVLELSQMRLADLKQDMALCADLMNMIDRRVTEHESSQREQATGRHGTSERAHETSRPDEGDEGAVQP